VTLDPPPIAVIELQLSEDALYLRQMERGSPRDESKLAEGMRGAGWTAFRELEGHSYGWPETWEVLPIDAAKGVDNYLASAVEFLKRTPARIVLLAGDAGAGKSTVLRELAHPSLPLVPLAMDWIKDPVKLAAPDAWQSVRTAAYRQLYFLVASLLEHGQRVLLEGTFKIETRPESAGRWFTFMEGLARGTISSSDLLASPLDL